MSTTPVKVDFTSRDYDSIRADLVKLMVQQFGSGWDSTDPSDFGVVLLESFAYMGDIMSYYIDRAANETSIDNAVLKKTLYNMAQIYGYRPSGPTPATVTLDITNNTAAAINLPAGTQCVANITYGSETQIYFETTQEITGLAAGATSSAVPAIEGKTSNTDVAGGISTTTLLPIPILLVDSSGVAVSSGLPNQERTISESNVVDGSVTVYVGQGATFRGWRFIDNLIEAGPLDQVFTTRVNSDGTTVVVFGDGVNGAIPESGHTLSALYRTSSGYGGNVGANTITEVSYVPGSSVDITAISVTNSVAASGGANADDLAQIKKKLKKAILARRRAVTLADYEALASTVSGVGRVKASATTPRSVTLWAQTQNDFSISPGWNILLGTPTAAWYTMRDSISNYMADKIPIGSSITISSPTYVDLALEVTVTVASNYRNSAVQTYVTNALIDPNGGQFSYNTYGFGSTVALSDIIVKLMSVPGVVNVNVNILDRATPGTGSADVQLADQELPRLLETNLTVNASGGIS